MTNEALRALCKRRLNLDLSKLSPAEIRERLPDIVGAVEAERRSTVALVSKAACLTSAIACHCPNPGLSRDEQVSGVDPDQSDENAVFDSAFPFGD